MKYRTRVLIGTLLLTIFLVSTVFPASAFSYSGYKWDTNYVVPKIDPSVPSSWSTAIQAATTTWNNAGADFTFKWILSVTDNRIYYEDDGAGAIAYCLPTRSGSYNTRYRMYFNSNYAWSTSGASGCYDVQNIATHEFGHWLTLNDLYDSTDSEKTMYGYASTGETKKRTLHSDDIAGINYIYP